MSDTETKELLAKDKMEAAVPAEPTVSGRVFTPAVDIFETDKEITLNITISLRPPTWAQALWAGGCVLSGEILIRNRNY